MKRFRRRHDDQQRRNEERAPLFVILASLLLYFLRFGYDYGSSDQDEIIPYLLHRLDPGLFTQDWFVQLQMSEFSVRTYFVWMLNAFALLLPIWLTVLVVYVAAWIAIAAAIYRLAFLFTRDQLAACAAIVFALVLTPVWTLGGNDLVHSMLVASMVAWAIGLWAIFHFLNGRYLIAPVLLGVACWIQALVGLHLAILLLLIRVIRYLRQERGSESLGGIVVFGALFALWSSPALGPIIYQQLFVRPPDLNADPSLFYILAEFRLPHHYLPASFYLHNSLRFGMVAALGGGALVSRGFRRSLSVHQFLTRMLAIIAVICGMAVLFTEIVPVLFVAKLQLFKMTVLAKLIFVIVLSGFLFYWMPEGIRRGLQALLRRPRWGLTVVVLIWAGVFTAIQMQNEYLRDRVAPFRRADEPQGHVEMWAKRYARSDAIFSVPPSWSSFRSHAQRTIVINFKAIPFHDDQMVTWFTRLRDMAPIELPDRGGSQIVDDLDSAYERLKADSLVVLSDKYRFNYVVRSTPLIGADFELAFRDDPWRVYRRVEREPIREEADPDSLE